MLAASILYLVHLCRCGSSPGPQTSQTYTIPTHNSYSSPNSAPYLSNNLTASNSQTVLIFVTLFIFCFNWVFSQMLFGPENIHIFDFSFCFANVIQSTLLFSTLCLLSDDARFAWHYFWAPSHPAPKTMSMNASKFNYDGSLLSENNNNSQANKLALSFSGSAHSPSVSPNSPSSPTRNGKFSNGTLTRNPGYTSHDGGHKFNSLTDVRSGVTSNGAVIFGDTKEIKQAVACLNTQGSFGSSVSSGLNPETSSDRFQRGDPYAASYPQTSTLLREASHSPTFTNPDRESYV